MSAGLEAASAEHKGHCPSLLADATALWSHIPVVPPLLLVAFVLIDGLLTAGVVVVFALGWLTPIQRATAGLINRTLLGNLVLLVLVIGLLLFAVGGLRPRDVGLRRSDLPTALAVTAGLWVTAQVAGAVVGLITHSLALNPAWRAQGAIAMLGLLIGQLCGNALYEEVAWRGFFLPQLYRRFTARWPTRGAWPLVLALVVSQSFFALRHIPIRLLEHVPVGDLPFDLLTVALLGVLFALLYLRRHNLLVAVGVHALVNEPTALVPTAGASTILILALLLLLALLVWPRIAQRHRPRIALH